MAKKKSAPKKTVNTNFTLGLTRQQLIESAISFGRSEKSAKKASTKSLENLVTRTLGGKGTKPTQLNFSPQQLRDVQDSAKNYGVNDALYMIATKIRRSTGSLDENNFLRLTIINNFSVYYEGQITFEMVSELISLVEGKGSRNEIISGVIEHKSVYPQIFEEYAEKLNKEMEAKNKQTSG